MNERVFKYTEAHKLDDPERLKWLPPSDVLNQLSLRPGMKVADIGAGTGYFSIPISHAVGKSGHVFAVDLQPEMLNLLRNKLSQTKAPGNISLLQGTASKVPLDNGSVDLVFFANIWHELDDHNHDYFEARRIAVPGGRIAILDWHAELAPPPGPPQHQRIPSQTVFSFLECRGKNVRMSNVGLYGYLAVAEF
jgi:ubiquinone/menaquinone biosynthesis C-methylase UbiE